MQSILLSTTLSAWHSTPRKVLLWIIAVDYSQVEQPWCYNSCHSLTRPRTEHCDDWDSSQKIFWLQTDHFLLISFDQGRHKGQYCSVTGAVYSFWQAAVAHNTLTLRDDSLSARWDVMTRAIWRYWVWSPHTLRHNEESSLLVLSIWHTPLLG